MGIFSKIFKRKLKDSYDSRSETYFFGRSNSGKPVNDRTALQLVAVYACIRVLSESIAQLPIHIYQYTDNGKEKVTNHALYPLLHDQPNHEMTSFVFREVMMSHLLIYGNAYAQIIRNNGGRIVGIYPLMADRMKVDRDEQNRLIYRYRRYDNADPNLKDQGEIVLQAEDVLHIPGLGYDGLVGYSPIALAKNALGISLACEEYGASFFANGASPSGVLEHPGTIKNPDKVRNLWRETYGGTNAHKTAVLEEGIQMTTADKFRLVCFSGFIDWCFLHLSGSQKGIIDSCFKHTIRNLYIAINHFEKTIHQSKVNRRIIWIICQLVAAHQYRIYTFFQFFIIFELVHQRLEQHRLTGNNHADCFHNTFSVPDRQFFVYDFTDM